jgi:HEAT repeat protein
MRAILLLAAFVTLAASASAQPEPRYKGKPLAYWVDRLQNAETDKEQQETAVALQAFGPDAVSAVPKLVEMLDDRSPEFRKLVYETLRELGPAAKGAVPDLIKLLKQKHERNTQYAIWLLEKLGPDAKDAVPELMKFLDAPGYREDAVGALCAIGPASREVLPAIRRALLDALSPEPTGGTVMEEVLNQLHRLGPDAAPMLVDLIASETPKGMAYGISELGNIGPGAVKAAPRLAEFLTHEDLELRRLAAIALCKINKSVKAVQVLAALLSEPTWHACPAAEALGEMGPDAREALPALRAALLHEDTIVQHAAKLAIRKIEAVNPAKN